MSEHTWTLVGLYFLAVWQILGTLLVVGTVGKPKKPTTGGTAAFVVLIAGLTLMILLAAAAQLRGA